MSETKTTKAAKTVELVVNGTPVGPRVVKEGTTLREFVQAASSEFGIRSYCVMSGGQTIKKDEGDKAITEFSKIEINAKDSRGSF